MYIMCRTKPVGTILLSIHPIQVALYGGVPNVVFEPLCFPLNLNMVYSIILHLNLCTFLVFDFGFKFLINKNLCAYKKLRALSSYPIHPQV